jgi:predicted SprT family Zn-dependent metalloprotease
MRVAVALSPLDLPPAMRTEESGDICGFHRCIARQMKMSWQMVCSTGIGLPSHGQYTASLLICAAPINLANDKHIVTLAQARQLALQLMKLHKLSPKWSFRFDDSKVRFGRCNYGKKEISLSRYLVELNHEDEVRDTILHEIAHALAPRGAGHGPKWRSVALSIGCNGRRCYGDDVIRPRGKYKGTCPSCKRVVFRHRRTVIACGRCTPVFDKTYAFVWSEP